MKKIVDVHLFVEIVCSKQEIEHTTHCWDPDQKAISPLSTPASGSSFTKRKCIIDDPKQFINFHESTTWNIKDISMAGKLLQKPPIHCRFDDEQEMKRVYAMIYDIYRCKCSKQFSK